MLETGPLALALVLGVVIVLVAGFKLVTRSGRSAEKQESWDRHQEAQQREPPVDLGDTRTVAIEEFSDHHSGNRRGVGKIEGFVVFIEDLPADAEVTDVVRIKILSFNRGHTSATATFLDNG